MTLLEKKITYAKSKFGRVEFKYIPNSDDRSGLDEEWTIHRIDVYLNSNKIGYCRVRYISDSDFNKYFSNILNYIAKFTGELSKSILNNPIELVKGMSKIVDPYNKWISNLQFNNVLPKELPPSWWQDKYNYYYNILFERYKRDLSEFKLYFVNKPVVDYITLNSEYIKGGVGFALYIATAMFLGEIGLKLYASGLQSDLASSAWERMERKGLPITYEYTKWRGKRLKRKRLDYTKK